METAHLSVEENVMKGSEWVDTYRGDNWNIESVESLRKFEVHDDDNILAMLFHHSLPGKTLRPDVFDGKEISKLAEIALDQFKIKFTSRNETQAVC